jgi:hypothetical protein
MCLIVISELVLVNKASPFSFASSRCFRHPMDDTSHELKGTLKSSALKIGFIKISLASDFVWLH